MAIQLIIDNPGQGEWAYAGTQVSAADPGTGQWKTDATDTRIDISSTSRNGLSADSILSQFESGAQISLRVDGEDRIYTVSAAVNNGTWHELTVSVASSSTGFALVTDAVHSVGFRWPKGAGGGGGVTDHGALTGLADDDHPQYFNQARGDARYNTQAEVSALVATKADTTDTRFPTADEKGALAGTGTPSGSNRYVTDDDSRLTASSAHVAGDGSDHLDVATNTAGLAALGLLDQGGIGFGFGAWSHGGSALQSPAAGTFTVNNATPSSVTQLRLHKVGKYGTGGGVIDDLQVGDVLTFATPTSTLIGGEPSVQRYRINSALTDGGTYSQYTVVHLGGNGNAWDTLNYGVNLDRAAVVSGGSVAVEDAGSPVTEAVTKLNFAGAVVVTEPVDDEVTVTVTPGSAPVASWGPVGAPRTGVINPIASDYNASQIDNDAANVNGNVTGAFVSGALDTADAAIEAAQTDATSALANAATAQGTANAAKAKTDFLTVTGSVNLDTVASDTATNTANVGTNTSNISANTAKLANVATSITAVGAALVEDTTVIDQRDTLGLGSAAVEDVATNPLAPTIGDVATYVNVGGNAGLPQVDGSLLQNLPTGVSTFVALTDVNEPDYVGHAGQFVKVNAGATGLEFDTIPGGGDLLSTNNLSDVANPITATQNLNVEVGVDVAAFGHTHDVVSNVDNTAGNGVILGRDTAGSGDSEELTPAEVRTVLGLPNTTTDDALARYDGTTGTVQNSGVTLGDAGSMTWPGGNTVVDPASVESPTLQAKTALRTWTDHVQYGVSAPTIADVATRGIWWVEDLTTTTEPHFREGNGTNLRLKDGVEAKADLATHEAGATNTHAQIDAHIAATTSAHPLVDSSKSTIVSARKATAGTITAGQVVRLVDYDAGASVSTVELASAASAATMPVYGIASSSITNAATGTVVIFGELTGVDTATYGVGTQLYASVTAGGLTSQPPSGDTPAQIVAVVAKSDATTGILQVFNLSAVGYQTPNVFVQAADPIASANPGDFWIPVLGGDNIGVFNVLMPASDTQTQETITVDFTGAPTNASWTLRNSADQVVASGTGDLTATLFPEDTYTITWEDTAFGYFPPSPQTVTEPLVVGEAVTFGPP